MNDNNFLGYNLDYVLPLKRIKTALRIFVDDHDEMLLDMRKSTFEVLFSYVDVKQFAEDLPEIIKQGMIQHISLLYDNESLSSGKFDTILSYYNLYRKVRV